MDIFAKRLNQLIKENKTTKYRVAKDLQCSKQTVCNWADGFSEPKIEYLRKLARYFDVSADYLIGLENENGTLNSTYNNYGTHNGDVTFNGRK